MKGQNAKNTNQNKRKENANLHKRSATNVDLQEGRAKQRFASQSSSLLISNDTSLPKSLSFNCTLFKCLAYTLVSKAKVSIERRYLPLFRSESILRR